MTSYLLVCLSPAAFKYLSIEISKYINSAPYVIHTGNVDVRARQRISDPSHVEIQKSGLRGMRLDRLGCELRRFDLVHFFLADRPLHLFMRQGNGKASGCVLACGFVKPPVNVVRSKSA